MPRSLDAASKFSGTAARAFDLADRAFKLQEEGREIIHLSIGDPDFDTPGAVIESAIESLTKGRTHYSPIPGEPALRRAIADHASQLYHQNVSPEQIVVFSGAQNALFATMLCLAEAGDEVILIEPTYTTYDAVARAGGACPVRVPLPAEDGFQIRISLIERAISDRTRVILINSPGNPSGTVFDPLQLAALVDMCKQNQIWLVSDEVYWSYVFEGEHASPFAQPGGPEMTFVINSLSKSHAMTGWRLGWTIAPSDVAHYLVDLAQCMLFGVNQFVQDAAVTALTRELPELGEMQQAFRKRRDCLCAGLQRIAGLKVHAPAGGMFLLVDVSATGLDGHGFAKRLLESAGVSVVPGFGFGESMKNFVRIGYLSDIDILEEAIKRIARFMGSHNRGLV
jgi:arginine:pyruvate transaminase